MADFKRVIQNAINGLAHNTPETRMRVYDRARQTVQRQLDNLPANIDRSTFERQKDRVEAAILEVESQFSDADLTGLTVTSEDEEYDHSVTDGETTPTKDNAAEAQDSIPIHDLPPNVDDPPDYPKAEEGEQASSSEVPFQQEGEADTEPASDSSFNNPFAEEALADAHDEPEQSTYYSDLGHSPDVHDRALDNDIDDTLAISPAIINQPLEPVAERSKAFDGDIEPIKNIDRSSDTKELSQEGSTPKNLVGDDADAIIEAAVGQIQSKLDMSPANMPPDVNLGEKSFGLGVEALPEVPPPLKAKKSKKSPLVILVAAGLLVIMAAIIVIWRMDWGGFDQRSFDADLGTSTQSDVENSSAASVAALQPVPLDSDVDVSPISKDRADLSGLNTNLEAAVSDEKFTQRLNADGTEIDMGPADDGLSGTAIIEGTSVAALSAQDQSAVNVSETDSLGVTEDGTLIHRMFLYETSQGINQQARYDGSVVWTENRDASVGNRPYIEAQIQVPDRDIAVTIAIKQNSDLTLPVSHLFDISFSLPAGFEGDDIEQVVEIKFKDEEEQTGDALQAISAKIDPSFFIVGLQNDDPEIVDANIELMLQRNWIDIPITYTNGRKALITLEKGVAGRKIFDKVFAFWDENPIQ